MTTPDPGEAQRFAWEVLGELSALPRGPRRHHLRRIAKALTRDQREQGPEHLRRLEVALRDAVAEIEGEPSEAQREDVAKVSRRITVARELFKLAGIAVEDEG
jgi:hypothetical protein